MGNTPSFDPVREMCVQVAPATENSSYTVRHRNFKDRLIELPFEDEPDINTVWKLWKRGSVKFAKNDCMGIRSYLPNGKRGEFEFETYEEIHAQVEQLGGALDKLGVKAEDAIGIFSINRPEWMKSFMATMRQGAICVPLYDTLGPSAVTFILGDAGVETVFVSKENFDTLIENATEAKCVKTIIVFDPVTDEMRKKGEDAGFTIFSMDEFAKTCDKPGEPAERTTEDLVYYMYTSGTTGNPKGVRLSNKSVLSNVGAIIGIGIRLNEDDVYLSYLPLAHCLEALLQLTGLGFGASVGFYQGNIRLLTDDIMTLRPTIFAGVPRVYSRIYDKVQQTVEESGWVKKSIFDTAYKNQLENVRNGTRNPVWDSLVFNKTKMRLGGRVRMMATGAAPMPGHLMDFLKVVFCCDVFQGYGMTENAAAACVTPLGYLDAAGKVGEPIPSCEIKLADVPDMNYLHTDKPYPRGEVCIRGSNLFSGYHNLPDKTKEALDEDGWLHTGDIGQFLEDGAIQIIDRKKNIFKLAQGEYVAAEELEGIFKKSKYVGQIWIYGNSFHTTLVAVIVPDADTIMPWCKEQGIEGDFATATKDERVEKLISDDIRRIAKADKVASFKVPQDVIIENEINDMQQGFSPENDCLTPTFKLRRPQLLKRYKEQIDAIYEKRDGKPAKP